MEKFKILLKQVQSLPRKPEFMLIVGDIHVKPFKAIMSEVDFEIPMHVIAGNNDIATDRKVLREMFPDDFKGRDFYSFKHKSCLFIGICDAIPKDQVGHLSSQHIAGSVSAAGDGQCKWLKNQLAENENKAEHIFIFGHIAPHPDGIERNMFLAANDQTFLRKLILKYEPTALFFGHYHRRMRFKIGDSPVFIVRSSNWNFFDEPYGFLEVTVSKDTIRTEFILLDEKIKLE